MANSKKKYVPSALYTFFVTWLLHCSAFVNLYIKIFGRYTVTFFTQNDVSALVPLHRHSASAILKSLILGADLN